jgi:putative addiction module component (TIGR02574 family)
MSDKISMADVLRLSVAERILLVEDIWDSIANQPESLEVSDSQRAELDARVAAYRQDPSGGIEWDDLKKRLGR